MAESIVLAINVGVANGPTLAINRTLTVDAYDQFNVAVPEGAIATTIELLPTTTGKVKLLAVSSDHYDDNLSYTVNAAADVYKLDGPHLLIGAGAVSLLNAVPEKLIFANSSGANAQVRILIGRDAA
jgi:hypothetical protein